MSTEAAIAFAEETGQLWAIHLEHDGHLEDAGLILAKHYSHMDKIRELIELGDLSELGERVDPVGPHSPANPEKGVCLAYGRDYGENHTGAVPLYGLEELVKHHRTFTYVNAAICGRRDWFAMIGTDHTWVPLTEALAKAS